MTTSRGEQVRRQRLLRGLEQEDLARETGVSVRTLGRIEGGQSERSRWLPRLEEFLGIRAAQEAAPSGVTVEEASKLELLHELLRREIEERAAVVRLPQRLDWSREDLPSAERPTGELGGGDV